MKKITALLLIFTLLFSFTSAFAAPFGAASAVEEVGLAVYKDVASPSVGYIGGEWAVLGLARSGLDIPEEYFDGYYARAEQYVSDLGGVLHKRKYTEYSRVILALTAIGKNPENVGGYNLLLPLADFEKTVWQGINGAVWALIALDSGNYEIPSNAEAMVQASRELYVNYILENAASDGGWRISGERSEADITAMALCALSAYRDDERVEAAIRKALLCLSAMQNEDGGFESVGVKNAESAAQVLTALSELGIGIDDARFVKNGNTVLSAMMSFCSEGRFSHLPGAEPNAMATEQCFYALVSYMRFTEGKSGLYKMKASPREGGFSDISDASEKEAIISLASSGVIAGQGEGRFNPQGTVTRAEFTKMLVCALSLSKEAEALFLDVTPEDWFYPYVMTAVASGLVTGISENEFNPNGNVTREEAAVMIMRAAQFSRRSVYLSDEEEKKLLSAYPDNSEASAWATSALAYCVREKIIDGGKELLNAKKALTRAETAGMLYAFLNSVGEKNNEEN